MGTIRLDIVPTSISVWGWLVWWLGGCPWLAGVVVVLGVVGQGGLSVVGCGGVTFHMAVFPVRGVPPPLVLGTFFFVS